MNKFQNTSLNVHKVDYRLAKRLLKYLAPFYKWILLSIFLILLARLVEAFIPMFLGLMAQKILDKEYKNLSQIVIQGAFLIVILGAGYFFDLINVYLRSSVGSKALLNLRKDVFEHIQNLPVPFFDKEPVGKLMTRTMHDVDQINIMFSESIVPIFGSLVLFILIFISMIYLDYRIALIIFVAFPLILTLTNYFRKHQRKCYDSIRHLISQMNSFVQEHLAGVLTVRHFGLEMQERKKFEKLNTSLADGYRASVENFGFYIAGNDFLQNLCLIAAFAVLVWTPPFNAGMFFSFSLYVMMVFRPLADLAERYNVLQSAFAASERIFQIMDVPQEKSRGLELDEIETISFRDVWFSYKENEWVFRGMSFDIRKGESIAVVGPTGSGKTSMLNLLLRFYEFQKGDILINHKSIRLYSLPSLRRAFGIVLQDPILFSGNIQENVSLFDPSISERDVARALKYADLTTLTPHSPVKGLSAGQMQLITLSRLVVKGGRFVILDEATANIDPITEKAIQNTLAKILTGRGALVIAHRLSTIKDVDRILVLNQGRIAESGTHDQLILQQGIYEKLYKLQFI